MAQGTGIRDQEPGNDIPIQRVTDRTGNSRDAIENKSVVWDFHADIKYYNNTTTMQFITKSPNHVPRNIV